MKLLMCSVLHSILIPIMYPQAQCTETTTGVIDLTLPYLKMLKDTWELIITVVECILLDVKLKVLWVK